MGARSRHAALAAAFLAASSGCRTCNKPSEPTAPDAGSDAPTTLAAPSTSAPPVVKLPPAPCRAATATGSISAGDAGIATMGPVPEGVFIDLGAGARLVARDPVSTRETQFDGPGRLRACVGHEEESWLLGGGFDALPGSGERPGGEEWVMTPLGVVRYASAAMHIAASPSAVAAHLAKGTAFLWAAEGVTLTASSEAGAPLLPNGPDEWLRIDDGFTATLKAGPTKSADDAARAAYERCRTTSQAARSLAGRIAAHEGNVGELTPKHVVARMLARAACGVARVRASSLPPSDAQEGLLRGIDEAQATWKALGDQLTPLAAPR